MLRALRTVRWRVAVTVSVSVLVTAAATTVIAYQLESSGTRKHFIDTATLAASTVGPRLASAVRNQPTDAKAVSAACQYLEDTVNSGSFTDYQVTDYLESGARADQTCSSVDYGQLPDPIPTDGEYFSYGNGRFVGQFQTVLGPRSSTFGLFLGFDYTEQQRQLARLRDALLWVDLGAVLVAIALGLLLATGISRPIRRTAGAARRLGDGDLDARLPVRGSDDLAELAGNFNAMADRLTTTLRDLRLSQSLQQRFVSDVSHELRTPLAAMLAAADGLDSPDPHARARAVDLVRAQTRRMNTMVADLLEMSRFDAGQAGLELEPLDLVALAHDVVHSVAPGADVRVTAFGNPSVDADARRLHTVLRNLVANAVQHGVPPVDVVIDGRADPIAITVADDGPGIPPELAATVFDRFVRGDTARSDAGTSTGLGLAIAAENARLHGATLDLATEGRTAFTLHLPRRVADDERSGTQRVPDRSEGV